MWLEVVDVQKAVRGEVDGSIALVECLLLAIVEADAILQTDHFLVVEEERPDGRVAGIDLLEAVHDPRTCFVRARSVASAALLCSRAALEML